MTSENIDTHFRFVLKGIRDGRIVPFLGAGVNRCNRPSNTQWEVGQHLPDGTELSQYLGDNFDYPNGENNDLVRVSQYIAVMTGLGPLYEELRKVLDYDIPPTQVHRFLADLPSILREKNHSCPCQLIVSTNYDDVLDRAFIDADEQFDIVSYIAEGENKGKFVHRFPDGSECIIDKPNEYNELPIESISFKVIRPIILKIHGAINRVDSEKDSFVITEDHYIEYLTISDISKSMPPNLVSKLKKSNFLFMGYGLRDWNLRVILHRIWREQKLDYRSWAIQLNPEELDKKFWIMRGIEILDIQLEQYIDILSQKIRSEV